MYSRESFPSASFLATAAGATIFSFYTFFYSNYIKNETYLKGFSVRRRCDFYCRAGSSLALNGIAWGLIISFHKFIVTAAISFVLVFLLSFFLEQISCICENTGLPNCRLTKQWWSSGRKKRSCSRLSRTSEKTPSRCRNTSKKRSGWKFGCCGAITEQACSTNRRGEKARFVSEKTTGIFGRGSLSKAKVSLWRIWGQSTEKRLRFFNFCCLFLFLWFLCFANNRRIK